MSEWSPVESNRFWPYVVRKADDCWTWVGSRNADGYGRLVVRGRYWMAHRLSWVIEHGPIPAGLQVCHRCDNRVCVNPSHLFLGTAADNIADCHTKKRSGYQLGKVNPPRLAGEHHPRRKLTLDQVNDIRRRHASGEDALALSRQFGVSRNQIYLIAKGKSWATA